MPDWETVVRRDDSAGPALRAALYGDDPVIRREAATMLEAMSRDQEFKSHAVADTHGAAPPTVATGSAFAIGVSTPAAGARATLDRLATSARGRTHAQDDQHAKPKVLILTPAKDAVESIPTYCRLLQPLTYSASAAVTRAAGE